MSDREKLIATLQALPANTRLIKNRVGNLIVALVHPKTNELYDYGYIDLIEMSFDRFDWGTFDDGTALAELLGDA
jgi:hypothetical protein